METVRLRPDELESLRLADLEGLYQEPCAERMGISRTTLSRTLAEARGKVADALINGKRLIVAASPADLAPPSDRCPGNAEGRGIDQALGRQTRPCQLPDPLAVASARPQETERSDEENRDEEDCFNGK
jgi:transcriptional regulator with XRE-family HTH domain